MSKPDGWLCQVRSVVFDIPVHGNGRCGEGPTHEHCCFIYTAPTIRKAWEEFAEWCENKSGNIKPNWLNDYTSEGLKLANIEARRRAKEW